jgi:hypothetical protein
LSTAITNYYGLVPGNLTQAWGELTADFQQNKALGFGNYQSFWKGMQRVTVSDVQEGGVWKIAHSTVVSSRSI